VSPSDAYEVSWRVRLKVPYGSCEAKPIHPKWFPRFPVHGNSAIFSHSLTYSLFRGDFLLLLD
jgi:hypothetical protein